MSTNRKLYIVIRPDGKRFTVVLDDIEVKFVRSRRGVEAYVTEPLTFKEVAQHLNLEKRA